MIIILFLSFSLYATSFIFNTGSLFDNVMQKIVNEKPMELLRGERSFLLQQTDWRITKGLEEGLDITPWKNYRSALRNLPQEIEAGSITAPTMNENEELIFNDWPTPPIE